MEEDTVRQAIHDLIEKKERRAEEIREDTVTELRSHNRMLNEHTITCIENGIAILIELEHNLKLCGCPDEAYQEKEDLA